MTLAPGHPVAWKWAGRVIEGVVLEVSTERTEIESKGKIIARNGSPENPAVIIEHSSGNPVLKLHSELLFDGF